MAHTNAAILVSLMLADLALAAEHRPVSVVCRGGLPFGQAELLAAITLRLPLMRLDLAGRSRVVQVQAAPGQRAAIRVGSSRRMISLGGLSGADAARVVALLSLDLISNQQQAPVVDRSPPGPTPAPRSSDLLFVGVSPRVSFGVSQWAAAFEPTVDLNVKISRFFFVYLEAMACYGAFSDAHPTSPHHRQALTALIRLSVSPWDCARARGAIAQYLSLYPAGSFAREARRLRKGCR